MTGRLFAVRAGRARAGKRRWRLAGSWHPAETDERLRPEPCAAGECWGCCCCDVECPINAVGTLDYPPDNQPASPSPTRASARRRTEKRHPSPRDPRILAPTPSSTPPNRLGTSSSGPRCSLVRGEWRVALHLRGRRLTRYLKGESRLPNTRSPSDPSKNTGPERPDGP